MQTFSIRRVTMGWQVIKKVGSSNVCTIKKHFVMTAFLVLLTRNVKVYRIMQNNKKK